MPAPFLIFCADPLDPRSVEADFAAEVEPARAAGFAVVRLDHDELDRRNDAEAALRKARFDAEGPAVYRGWMLGADAYSALFDALRRRGIGLVTTPGEYAACHHAPGSYAKLAQWMPETVWLAASRIDDAAAIRDVLAPFGRSAVIVKDWVKSQAAGYWDTACYIPDASDESEVNRVISRFRELQGESLVGGLVFKRYIPLRPGGGQPAHEFRALIVGGRSVGCWPRSPQAGTLEPPPEALLQQIAAQVPSPFASMDFGLDVDGRWWLLEVGDGQVSGLPDPNAAAAMFGALADRAAVGS